MFVLENVIFYSAAWEESAIMRYFLDHYILDVEIDNFSNGPFKNIQKTFQ